MTGRSDEELMTAYVRGDEDAFTELFGRLAPRLHSFLARSFTSSDVVYDLLQTTFLKVHAARASFRIGEPVRPWIFSIAARVRTDELRRRYRVPVTVSDTELADLALAEPTRPLAETDQLAEHVRRAIDQLPDGQRVVLLLHKYEEMTFAEIGSVLGVAEGTVRVRAFRALARLREQLGPLVLEPGERSASSKTDEPRSKTERGVER